MYTKHTHRWSSINCEFKPVGVKDGHVCSELLVLIMQCTMGTGICIVYVSHLMKQNIKSVFHDDRFLASNSFQFYSQKVQSILYFIFIILLGTRII